MGMGEGSRTVSAFIQIVVEGLGLKYNYKTIQIILPFFLFLSFCIPIFSVHHIFFMKMSDCLPIVLKAEETWGSEGHYAMTRIFF